MRFRVALPKRFTDVATLNTAIQRNICMFACMSAVVTLRQKLETSIDRSLGAPSAEDMPSAVVFHRDRQFGSLALLPGAFVIASRVSDRAELAQ